MSDNYGIDDEPSDHVLGNGARQHTSDRTTAGPAALQLPKRRPVFAGYTAGQLIIGAAILIALVWAMWVTRAMTAEKPQRIVKVELSKIVGEYVQAQARSATPPDQVQAQMRSFLASVDAEVQRHGANGEIVMVGEAVLTKGVPDITADVAKAVYASGVRTPVPATPTQMGAMLQGQVPTASVAAPATAPVVSAQVAPTAPAANPFAGMPVPAAGQDVAAVDPSIAGAAVSTFGGPGVQ